MKRTMTLLAVLAMVSAACGGTTEETTTTSSPGQVDATTTTTAPQAQTTTTEAPEPTGGAGFVAAAVAYLGEYLGQWDNDTFGSSGALKINVIEANTDAGFVLIQVDADGNAFGASDPDLFVIEISTAGEGLHVGFSTFLGESTFEIDDQGNFTMSAMPPLLEGLPLEVTGSITADGFAGTYEIPGLATGSWSVEPTS